MYDEFNSMYDDWMIETELEIQKTFVAKDMYRCVERKYSEVDNEKLNHFYDRALTTHQKLIMMMFAKWNFHKAKDEFEGTQNMNIPALYGMGNTMIVFYIESMIVFARNALDVSAKIYGDILLERDIDSFNKFSKYILRSTREEFKDLKQYFIEQGESSLSAFRLLCGSERGRALRDVIIHQANVRLEYHEYKENSEKEHLFLILKDISPIDIEWFVAYFVDAVEEIFEQTTLCCERILMKKSLVD